MDSQTSPSSTPSTQPTSPVSAPQPSAPSPQGSPQKKKMWIFIGIGAAVLVLLIVVISIMMQGGQKNGQSGNNGPAKAFTVGEFPYIEACSVVTEAAFRQSFSLTGEPNIGITSHENALPDANNSSEGDVTKLSPETNKKLSTSDCSVGVAPTPQAKRIADIDAKIMQYTSADEAKRYLDGRRSFETTGGAPVPPTLPSFPSSLLKLPSAQGASSTIVATTLHNHINIELSYLMAAGETADSVIPKLDNLTKLVIQNIDNKDVASRSSNATGHVTLLGKPFVDTCYNIGLKSLAQKLEDIQFNVRASRVDQYGALAGSSAAADGVGSSCTLTYNTSKDRESQTAASSSSKTASELTQKQKYPHTLMIETNKYASASEAKKMLDSRKAQQARLNLPESPVTIRDISGLGDAAFVSHKKDEIPDFSLDGSNKRSLVQDTYIILKGNDLVTISFQQSESAKTSPLVVKDSLATNSFSLFETLLSK